MVGPATRCVEHARTTAASSIAALAVGAVLATGQVAVAEVRYQTIALTGRPAQGAGAGVNYAALFTPGLNNSGQVALSASLAGNGVTPDNDQAIFVGSYSSPQLVAREGDPAPGAPAGVSYASVTLPRLNDSGQMIYLIQLRGLGVTTANDSALYAGSFASPQIVAREGDPAPGTTSNYGSFHSLALNDAGQVFYQVGLTFSGGHHALYGGSANAPQLVARIGSPAPGAPAGVNYSAFHTQLLTDAGVVAYAAELSGAGVTTANDEAIFGGSLASPQMIAREGDPAPGAPAGVLYSRLAGGVSLNDAGQIAFRAMLKGTGVTGANEWAIFHGNVASPHMTLRSGTAAHGLPAGVNYQILLGTAQNNAGDLLYAATLTGSGVTFDNDDVLYAGPVSSPTLIARSGDHAPGTPAGVNYEFFSAAVMNDGGLVAYTARLIAGGVTPDNDWALFAHHPTLGQFLIAREGNPFDVGGGDIRTIDGVSPLALEFAGPGNDGTIAMKLRFTDGTSGVFTAVVPEPAIAVPALGASLLALRHLPDRGRRRARRRILR